MWKDLGAPFTYPRMRVKLESKQRAKAKDWKGTLRKLWMFLALSRFRLGFVVLMVLFSSGFALAGPLLVGTIVDEHLVKGNTEGLLALLIGLALVYMLHPLTLWLQSYWMIGIAQKTVFTMRVRLFEHLHQLPISFFDKRQHGELMSRVTNDMENVSTSLNNSVIQILTSILTLIGTVSVMLWLSPLMTLIVFAIVPPMVFGTKWVTNRTGPLFKELQKNIGSLNGHVEETLSGQRIVKTFSLERKVIEGFEQKNEGIRQSGFWAQTYSGFIPKLINALNNLCYALLVGVGGILAVNEIITIGIIIIFVEYSRQFTRPLHELANQFNTLLAAIAGAERVFEILDETEETKDEKEAVDLPVVRGDVLFSQVSFSYEKDGEMMSNISFHASQGETIAFVGPTGAGKTTVLNLLTRFYDANSGTIRIDGIDIKRIRRESLRKHMAFVLQDPFMFKGTIRDNIRYGKINATDKEVEEAAKLANAHSFIMKLPKQYDTVLRQDGSGISQGQKQLLSIARAALADPSILILDEATSSIDTVTEIKIQEALLRLMNGRTSFVIAHRLNTIQKADQIIVLKEGQIIEKGSHEQLLGVRGFYYELYNSQFRAEIKELQTSTQAAGQGMIQG